MRFGLAGFVVYEKKMGRLLDSERHPTALYASSHETTRDCSNNVMGCVERRAQAHLQWEPVAGESVCGGAPRSVALHESIAATRIVPTTGHQSGTVQQTKSFTMAIT